MLRLLRSTVRMDLLSVKLWRRKKSVLVLLSHLRLQKSWLQCMVVFRLEGKGSRAGVAHL